MILERGRQFGGSFWGTRYVNGSALRIDTQLHNYTMCLHSQSVTTHEEKEREEKKKWRFEGEFFEGFFEGTQSSSTVFWKIVPAEFFTFGCVWVWCSCDLEATFSMFSNERRIVLKEEKRGKKESRHQTVHQSHSLLTHNEQHTLTTICPMLQARINQSGSSAHWAHLLLFWLFWRQNGGCLQHNFDVFEPTVFRPFSHERRIWTSTVKESCSFSLWEPSCHFVSFWRRVRLLPFLGFCGN